MLETGVVVGYGKKVIHWHEPVDRTSVSLPDTRDLWDVIWENRSTVQGFAHSHPGSGIPCPSDTDITTFDAIERALGRRLCWWITSEDTLIAIRYVELPAYAEEPPGYREFFIQRTAEPAWVRSLRSKSYKPLFAEN